MQMAQRPEVNRIVYIYLSTTVESVNDDTNAMDFKLAARPAARIIIRPSIFAQSGGGGSSFLSAYSFVLCVFRLSMQIG